MSGSSTLEEDFPYIFEENDKLIPSAEYDLRWIFEILLGKRDLSLDGYDEFELDRAAMLLCLANRMCLGEIDLNGRKANDLVH
ncbi:MAG: hypothetical protein AAGB02_05035 [Pseudomonadota bacterium]